MSRTYHSSDVFQPTSFPDHTYVNRLIDGRETYESRLRKALKTKGVLTLITGPSKSGKTVLYHSVIPADQIIEISGSHIRTPEDFWTQIAEKLDFSRIKSYFGLSSSSLRRCDSSECRPDWACTLHQH